MRSSLKEKNKDVLILYKNTGKFFNAIGIDAYVLNYYFGYKVIDNKKAGFPESAFEKVVQKLEENKISYQIIYSDKNPVIKNYKKLNCYGNVVEKVRRQMEINSRIDLVIEKIKNASLEEIEGIIERIEECFI